MKVEASEEIVSTSDEETSTWATGFSKGEEPSVHATLHKYETWKYDILFYKLTYLFLTTVMYTVVGMLHKQASYNQKAKRLLIPCHMDIQYLALWFQGCELTTCLN